MAAHIQAAELRIPDCFKEPDTRLYLQRGAAAYTPIAKSGYARAVRQKPRASPRKTAFEAEPGFIHCNDMYRYESEQARGLEKGEHPGSAGLR